MKNSPRVVLDTNVVLSTLLFSQGRLAPLRHAWQQPALLPLVSRATTEELIRVLGYPKFKLNTQDRQELLADYLPYCITVAIPARPPKTPACRDPFDVPFLQLAVSGKADYLVTGDKDLLVLGGKLACRIVTADELLSSLAKA